MAQRGGKRPGAGRKPGAQARATKERRFTLSDMAQKYSEEALEALASVMRNNAEPASARVAAANALLDRGFGKPSQGVQITGPDDGPVQTIDPSKMSTDALAELMGALNGQAPEPDEG